ncbi:MAG: hypothetical protein FWE82_04690 [Defluviitaleaceae bacterium]|nr:hypothetical protein [Defluviitaleaceae bacterium]
MWRFEYKGDPCKEGTMLDLRYLNEKTAGETGFVGLSNNKEAFVKGDGSLIRFWAFNSFTYRRSFDELKTHARFLAKIGVNMVRMHGSANPKKPDQIITGFDETNREQAWRMVAAMKEQGIYSTISPYWPHNGHCGNIDAEAYWGIQDYKGDMGLWGLLFFNEKMQEGYKAWTSAMYTEKNPYTGVALCEETAIAIIQIQNEDSLLFWTVDHITGAQRKLLEKKFTEWSAAKYGSFNAAKNQWDGFALEEDDATAGRFGVMRMWNMVNPNEPTSQRAADTAEFLTRTMYDFHEMIERHYRSIGCKQLINANNWRPANLPKLNDLERWSNTPNAVIGLNRYFTGLHDGPYNGWRIDAGDKIIDQSATKNPRALTVNIKQVAGCPHIVPESTWVTPLRYQAEGPLLVSAYSSLTGVNIFYWFATGDVTYADDHYFTKHASKGEPGFSKWSSDIPALQGMFPAAALLFREGYIKQAEPVIYEERSLEDMFKMKYPVITEDEGFDPNRDEGLRGKENDSPYGIDALTFLAGPVRVKYGTEISRADVKPLDDYIDKINKTVRSVTEELKIDYGKGIFTMNSPCAKGAAGFLNTVPSIDLKGVRIKCENDYLSVVLVSMDKQPLNVSKKILLQVGTVMMPEGFETVPDVYIDKETNETVPCERITKTGNLPWVAEDIRVVITIDNKFLERMNLLDENGETRKTESIRVNNAGLLEIYLPHDAMYIILDCQ